MNIPDFVVDYGNGILVDSLGQITSDVPDGVAVFSPSHPLPIPGKAVADVFGAVNSVLPQMEKIGGILQVKDSDFFKALGMTQGLIDTFGKVGEIATTVAAVIPYVNLAVALINIFGAFHGADPLATLIQAECEDIKNQLREEHKHEVSTFTNECLAAFDPALNAVNDYKTTLSKPKEYRGPTEVADNRIAALNTLVTVDQKLTEALTFDWTFPFDSNDYFDHWGYLQDVLHTVPTSGAEVAATLPTDHMPFDHRQMVLVLAKAIQVYLTLIKAVVPEHRTTGKFHTALGSAAHNLSTKLELMREKTLARTKYKAGVPYFKEGARQFYVLAVGAMDLRNDTDQYFLANQNPADHPLWHRTGNLYEMWTLDPLVPNRGSSVKIDGDTWWTINPAAVDLANQQSERDYAAMLTRSGYFTLAHLEALMRHLATEPDRSETVTASAETWRKPQATTTVKVKNDKIPFSDPIVATAWREPQECKAYIFLTTQPIPNDSAIGYRVRLLTLPNGRPETSFDEYVWTDYVTDPASPRDRELRININDGVPLDPVDKKRLLIDSISPAQPVQEKGTVQLTADTFDWYIPIPDNPMVFRRVQDMKAGAAVIGGGAIGPQPFPPPAPDPPGGGGLGFQVLGTSRVLTASDVGPHSFGWDEGEQTWKGDKREWERTQIQIDYELYWHEDQLSITLKARPKDRNYVVYLVVEEYLARSGQFLRTPVRIQFNGQLTYVPQSFFDAEQKAIGHAGQILRRIEKDYSVSRQPGPSDPVTGWVRPGTMSTVEGMQEFLKAARQHAPEIVKRALASK